MVSARLPFFLYVVVVVVVVLSAPPTKEFYFIYADAKILPATKFKSMRDRDKTPVVVILHFDSANH